MKLTDLEPRWLHIGGKRLGFAFRSPVNRDQWQTCMPTPLSLSSQMSLWEASGFSDADILQPCNPGHRWQIAGGIDEATFETMTVTPSLDGSRGGLWHGFITNGQIVGGCPEKTNAEPTK
ncbi:MAG: hypothetical protein AB7J28_15810 [Hyphomonadaceae bacterium]